MTMPIVPDELLPWIEFADGKAHLKPDAPEDLRPKLNEFNATMKRLQQEALPKI